MFFQRTKSFSLYKNAIKNFTGKTETGFRFSVPKMRMKKVKPIYPPPGMDLALPSKFSSFIY